MIFVETDKSTNEVQLIVYYPFHPEWGVKHEDGTLYTEEELKQRGYLTELQPNPQPPEGYVVGKEMFTEEEGFTYEYVKIVNNPYGIPDELVARIKDDAVEEIKAEVIKNNVE